MVTANLKRNVFERLVYNVFRTLPFQEMIQDPVRSPPLTWLFSLKYLNSKLDSEHLKLEQHEYNVGYKEGKENTNADQELKFTRKKLQRNYKQMTQKSTLLPYSTIFHGFTTP